jgi:hypothetical protein
MSGGAGYTTYFRALDPRIGRWLTPDPKVFPWQSPYCSMDGNPVALIDPWGASTEGGGYLDQPTANSGDASAGAKYKDNNGRVFQNRGEGLGWKEITPPSVTANTPTNTAFNNIAGQTEDSKSWMQKIADWLTDNAPVIHGYTIIDNSAQCEQYRRDFKEHQIFSLPGLPYGYLDKDVMFSYPGHGKIGRGVTFNNNMASATDKVIDVVIESVKDDTANKPTPTIPNTFQVEAGIQLLNEQIQFWYISNFDSTYNIPSRRPGYAPATEYNKRVLGGRGTDDNPLLPNEESRIDYSGIK